MTSMKEAACIELENMEILKYLIRICFLSKYALSNASIESGICHQSYAEIHRRYNASDALTSPKPSKSIAFEIS